MSGASVGPGPRSLAALAWLARVGASELEPLRLVMGWTERRAHDHVRRLFRAGSVERLPMRRGQGSLIVLTRQGALEAGYPATRAPRSIGPTNWAHACACAWTCAWLEVRGRTWWGERDIIDDDFWKQPVSYDDRRGTVDITHRPDLAARLGDGPLVAFEVELHRKNRARLLGILQMYEDVSFGDNARLAGVIYVCGNNDVREFIARVGARAGLTESNLDFRMLDTIVEQARAAASERDNTRRDPSAPNTR